MIPVEYLWLALIVVFGVTGMVRGLWKELGVTTVMLLSLFVLTFGWDQIGSKIVEAIPAQTSAATIRALYYIIPVVFIAFIAYEGITLIFPMREMKGLLEGNLGVLGRFAEWLSHRRHHLGRDQPRPTTLGSMCRLVARAPRWRSAIP